ncbi:MAG: hypothetical protein D6785_01770 [Planctomycetota bacterium]|nr:MAG: hypothetical protein D6785_01770 [Planctomycetota bacterium]
MVYQSLQPLFSPKTVAIVGASRDKNSIGYSIVHNLVNSEFTGLVYPVNPKARAVHSIPCYPSLLEIPVDIDLAVVAVPRDNVLEVMKNALAKKVKALVIITAGFREVGEEGRLLEEKILQMARQGGIRMVGPNCMGIINTQPQISLNATFAPIPARPGHVGFVSQSGALGVAILNVADKLGLGLTQFISMGNKADVSGNDMLEYWEKASETRVIAMYLESFGNPKKFVHLARRIGKQKPILVVKSGRTPEGARAASSHTGALAAGDITISALLDSCGVVRVETIQELFDTARVFVKWQKVEGKNVAILTNAGGPAIMATDSCVGLGLEIPALSQNTRQRLSTFLPKEASLRNPVDMIAAAGEKEYAQALQTLLEEPEIHMVLVIFVHP